MPNRIAPTVEEARNLFLKDPHKKLSLWAKEWGVSDERVRQLREQAGVAPRSAYNSEIAQIVLDRIAEGKGSLTTSKTYEELPIGYERFKAWMKDMPELVERVKEAKAKADKLSWNPNWKKCLECQEEKDISEFEKSQKYKSGYTLYCIDCLVGLRNTTHEYKETIKSEENSKICLVCQKDKPLNKFNKSKKDKNKREAICSLCHRKSNREKTS
tara:strand:+ start:255 stop:896 length:642 start_codon:yes stop_codon:yes gene_type:complete